MQSGMEPGHEGIHEEWNGIGTHVESGMELEQLYMKSRLKLGHKYM